MLISFIVPVFNIEKKLLNACLGSLKNTKRDDVEFIIVNDGSTNTDVCETFENFKDDSRFNFINKNNSGVGDTRNLGISLAKGKYLFFLDGDDLFQFKELDKCINYLLEDEYDVITLNANHINSKDKIVSKQVFGTSNTGTKFGLNVVWAKFIRKNFLVQNGVKFDITMKFLEDLNFMQDIFEHTDKYINIPGIVIYLHRVCIASVTSRYNPNALQDFSHSLSLIKDNYDDHLRSAFGLLKHNIFPTYYFHKDCHLKNKKKKITEDLMNTSIFKDLFNADSSIFGLKDKILFFFLSTENITLYI